MLAAGASASCADGFAVNGKWVNSIASLYFIIAICFIQMFGLIQGTKKREKQGLGPNHTGWGVHPMVQARTC